MPSDRRAPDSLPGTVLSVGDTIDVACSGGVLSLTTVLPEGKRAMSAKDFTNGRKIAPGGRMVFHKTPQQAAELDELSGCRGFDWRVSPEFELPDNSGSRLFIVGGRA